MQGHSRKNSALCPHDRRNLINTGTQKQKPQRWHNLSTDSAAPQHSLSHSPHCLLVINHTQEHCRPETMYHEALGTCRVSDFPLRGVRHNVPRNEANPSSSTITYTAVFMPRLSLPQTDLYIMKTHWVSLNAELGHFPECPVLNKLKNEQNTQRIHELMVQLKHIWGGFTYYYLI